MSKKIKTTKCSGLAASGRQAVQPTALSGVHLGASPSNTAPAKYIKDKYITHLRCAIDSLYVSYHGNLYEKTEEKLESLKILSQNEVLLISATACFYINEHKFEVKARGQGRFSYVLDDNWFHIQISSQKAKNIPLAYIQIKSELLTFNKLDSIFDDLNKIIKSLGEIIKPASVSRLDLCMDLTCNKQFNFEEIKIKQWRTRATQIDQYHVHKKLSGWRIGKGDVMARIYNKSLEILKSKNEYLKPLWSSQGWDSQTDVWRVEFQFRKGFLKNVLIVDANQILDTSPSLWKYATEQWLQLVIPSKDSNSSRWLTHPAWLKISSSCTNTQCKAVQKVTKKRIPNDQLLFINGISVFSSFMAREGISDIDEALGEFLHHALVVGRIFVLPSRSPR